MHQSWRIATAGLIVLVGVVACGPKKVTTPDEIVTETKVVTPPPEEVTEPPMPPVNDRTQALMSEDLQEVNAYARAEGLLGDVFFDFDKYELRAEALERLAKNASFLNEHQEFQVTIEGHCDERGTNDYNIALGERRGTAAKDFLSSLGVGTSRLRTLSYGEERPVCTELTESCWAQNRRAHFVITSRSAG